MLPNKPSERELGMLQPSKSYHHAAASHLFPRSHSIMLAHISTTTKGRWPHRPATASSSLSAISSLCGRYGLVCIHDEASGGLRARRHFRKEYIQEYGKALSGSVDPCTRSPWWAALIGTLQRRAA
jgi:hypothetical protein